MFTKIIMKNFRSFESVTLDLTEKKDTAKKLAVIYGENGSGKTTLALAILFLSQTLETMQVKHLLNGIINDNSLSLDELPSRENYIKNLLSSNYSLWGLDEIINQNKMIGNQSNMSIEYHFVIDGNLGVYYIETDDSLIVKEKLEYKLSKRRGCYFEIDRERIKINRTIFQNNECYKTIFSQVKKYWGKHSLLSILNFELIDKSVSYINDSFSSNLLRIILSFDGIRCYTPDKSRPRSGDCILNKLNKGSIPERESDQLCTVEKSLNRLFKSIFSDIVEVYYSKQYDNETINYELFLKKRLGNRIIDIDFDRESAGTKQFLNLVPAFVAACAGRCVVIDEYGVRIHDSLSERILNSILKHITGQLIITTHNTSIMDSSNLPAEALYFIKKDKITCSRSIDCITKIEKRLNSNYSYRNRYLHNDEYSDYSPSDVNDLDFSELIDMV